MTERTGERMHIAVTDHGVGMTNEQKATVFQLKKISTLGTNEETGTGLGLIVCNTLAQMIHGSLSFVSTEGEGSTFTLTLPITENAFNKTR